MSDITLTVVIAHLVKSPSGVYHIAETPDPACAGPDAAVIRRQRQTVVTGEDDSIPFTTALHRLNYVLAAEALAATVVRSRICLRCSSQWADSAPETLV